MNNLATINEVKAVEVFSSDNAEKLIEGIEKEVRSFVPDLSNVKGRKEIASLSAKVSKSKVVLDNLGKTLVADWKASAKLVDNDRRMVRDRLDSLRDEVRKPLTDWEAKEKASIEAERLAKELLQAHEQALSEDNLFNRQREIERKETEQIKLEADRVAKLEAERIEKERIERENRLEQDRIEREERIKLEAAENAKREEKEKTAKEKADAEQKIIDARAAIELEKLKAKEAAEQAERDKIQAVKDAELKAKQEADRVEHDRLTEEAKALADIARIKAIEEKKATNKRHQAAINNKILEQFKAIGVSEDQGKQLITAIAKKEIDYVSIQY